MFGRPVTCVTHEIAADSSAEVARAYRRKKLLPNAGRANNNSPYRIDRHRRLRRIEQADDQPVVLTLMHVADLKIRLVSLNQFCAQISRETWPPLIPVLIALAPVSLAHLPVSTGHPMTFTCRVGATKVVQEIKGYLFESSLRRVLKTQQLLAQNILLLRVQSGGSASRMTSRDILAGRNIPRVAPPLWRSRTI
jgi:hypothetical protein